jgi:hypothetical protein
MQNINDLYFSSPPETSSELSNSFCPILAYTWENWIVTVQDATPGFRPAASDPVLSEGTRVHLKRGPMKSGAWTHMFVWSPTDRNIFDNAGSSLFGYLWVKSLCACKITWNVIYILQDCFVLKTRFRNLSTRSIRCCGFHSVVSSTLRNFFRWKYMFVLRV